MSDYGDKQRSVSRSMSRSKTPRSRSRSVSRERQRSRQRSPRRSYSRSRSRDRRSRSRSRRRSPYYRGGRGSGGGGYGGYGGYGGGRYRRERSRSPMSSRRRHDGNRDDPEPNKCIGVFGLSLYTKEREVEDVFGKYGEMDNVQVVYDHQTGRSRGFAFVYYKDVEDAIEAKEKCNGIEIDGRRIRVDFSVTKRAHTPTPGIYLGKPTRGGGRPYRGRSPSPYRRRRSPSPYRRGRHSRSRSRSYSPRGRY